MWQEEIKNPGSIFLCFSIFFFFLSSWPCKTIVPQDLWHLRYQRSLGQLVTCFHVHETGNFEQETFLSLKVILRHQLWNHKMSLVSASSYSLCVCVFFPPVARNLRKGTRVENSTLCTFWGGAFLNLFYFTSKPWEHGEETMRPIVRVPLA